MFVVVAQWQVRAGHEDDVAAILGELIPATRAEPGCVMFTANRSLDDPRRFILYERFRDRAAFEAHTSSVIFRDKVLGQIVPLLESRVRDFCAVVEPA